MPYNTLREKLDRDFGNICVRTVIHWVLLTGLLCTWLFIGYTLWQEHSQFNEEQAAKAAIFETVDSAVTLPFLVFDKDQKLLFQNAAAKVLLREVTLAHPTVTCSDLCECLMDAETFQEYSEWRNKAQANPLDVVVFTTSVKLNYGQSDLTYRLIVHNVPTYNNTSTIQVLAFMPIHVQSNKLDKQTQQSLPRHVQIAMFDDR